MDDGEDIGIDAADLHRIGQIMAQLDRSDLERIEPPDEVWDGIEASVAALRARRPPPGATPPAPMVVEYRIDERDVLIDVGSGWAEFARANWAPELAVPTGDRTLWSFMDGGPIGELWQLLVHRVRTVQRPARVPFRCDAPHARRWFEMTIEPGRDGDVRFRSVLAFEAPRAPLALLDPSVDRDVAAAPVPLCSWCGRGQHGERWLDIDELLQASRLLEMGAIPPVTYGICAPCRAEMRAELLVPDRVGSTPA